MWRERMWVHMGSLVHGFRCALYWFLVLVHSVGSFYWFIVLISCIGSLYSTSLLQSDPVVRSSVWNRPVGFRLFPVVSAASWVASPIPVCSCRDFLKWFQKVTAAKWSCCSFPVWQSKNPSPQLFRDGSKQQTATSTRHFNNNTEDTTWINTTMTNNTFEDTCNNTLQHAKAKQMKQHNRNINIAVLEQKDTPTTT